MFCLHFSVGHGSCREDVEKHNQCHKFIKKHFCLRGIVLKPRLDLSVVTYSEIWVSERSAHWRATSARQTNDTLLFIIQYWPSPRDCNTNVFFRVTGDGAVQQYFAKSHAGQNHLTHFSRGQIHQCGISLERKWICVTVNETNSNHFVLRLSLFFISQPLWNGRITHYFNTQYYGWCGITVQRMVPGTKHGYSHFKVRFDSFH